MSAIESLRQSQNHRDYLILHKTRTLDLIFLRFVVRYLVWREFPTHLQCRALELNSPILKLELFLFYFSGFNIGITKHQAIYTRQILVRYKLPKKRGTANFHNTHKVSKYKPYINIPGLRNKRLTKISFQQNKKHIGDVKEQHRHHKRLQNLTQDLTITKIARPDIHKKDSL